EECEHVKRSRSNFPGQRKQRDDQQWRINCRQPFVMIVGKSEKPCERCDDDEQACDPALSRPRHHQSPNRPCSECAVPAAAYLLYLRNQPNFRTEDQTAAEN